MAEPSVSAPQTNPTRLRMAIAGVLLLGAGVLTGFILHGNPVLVLALLGGSCLAFAATLLLRRALPAAVAPAANPVVNPVPAKNAPAPTANAATPPAAGSAAGMDPPALASKPPPAGKDPQSVAATAPPARIEPPVSAAKPPPARIEPATAAALPRNDLTLVNTPLGDLLLETLLQQPDLAGALLARALTQKQQQRPAPSQILIAQA